MPLPFRKIVKKPGVRRFLWPFTLALVVVLAAFAVLGS